MYSNKPLKQNKNTKLSLGMILDIIQTQYHQYNDKNVDRSHNLT